MARKQRSRLNISLQRVQTKLDECDFFLDQLRDTHEPQAFAYQLSAFLAAFSTFVALSLIRRYPNGYKARLKQLRKNSPAVDRLLEFRDVEVHREGIRIWGFNQSLGAIPRFRGSLWGDLLLTPRHSSRFRSRFESRFPPRYGSGMKRALERITPNPMRHSFLFEDSGTDVIELCAAGLEAARLLLG